MHANELEANCYAPETIQLNPSLEFSDFSGTNRWTATKTDKSRMEDANELDYFLSASRVSIGPIIKLSVPRDSVAKRPFDIQFVAFPCDAPSKAKSWKGKIFVVAVRVDLPTFFPPGYRDPGADNLNNMTGTMLNSAEILQPRRK